MSVSELDFQQIIQRAFDSTSDRLKVDAELSASIIAPPGLEVSINSTDDNIAIRNSNNTNELLINSDGSINVNISGSGTSDVNLIQVGGINVSTNNGIADSGSQRVVIAEDNLPFPVNAVQSGGWTVTLGTGANVIGEVIQHQGVNYPWGIQGTVTANIGTTGGLALDSSLSTINTTLGSPFQAGGSIGNTSFGASQTGTWNVGRTWDLDFSTDQVDVSGSSVSVSNFPSSFSVTQGTSPWIVSGTVTANAGTNLNTSALNLESTQSAFKTANHNDLTTINTTLGTPAQEHITALSPSSVRLSDGASFYTAFKSGDSIGNTTFAVTQSTSPWVTSFSAPQHVILDSGTLTSITNVVHIDDNSGSLTVDNNGTFAVQSTQSGNWSVRLQDGSGTGITSTLFNSQQSLDVRPVTGFSSASNTRVSVAASSVQLLAANASRKYAYIMNQSGNVMFLKFGATAVANQGIRLANNAIYEINQSNLWTGTINAISSSATASSLDIFEGT
jgi:hypothetical protein